MTLLLVHSKTNQNGRSYIFPQGTLFLPRAIAMELREGDVVEHFQTTRRGIVTWLGQLSKMAVAFDGVDGKTEELR